MHCCMLGKSSGDRRGQPDLGNDVPQTTGKCLVICQYFRARLEECSLLDLPITIIRTGLCSGDHV